MLRIRTTGTKIHIWDCSSSSVFSCFDLVCNESCLHVQKQDLCLVQQTAKTTARERSNLTKTTACCCPFCTMRLRTPAALEYSTQKTCSYCSSTHYRSQCHSMVSVCTQHLHIAVMRFWDVVFHSFQLVLIAYFLDINCLRTPLCLPPPLHLEKYSISLLRYASLERVALGISRVNIYGSFLMCFSQLMG